MFENKAITGKGLFLLNALKAHLAEGARLRFDKAVGHIDALTKQQLHKPNILWDSIKNDVAYNQGTLFKVSPTKISSLSDSRVVIRFDDNDGKGRGIRSVFLFASLVKDVPDPEQDGKTIEQVIDGLDHVPFAVASSEHEMRIKNDDKNGMFVTFQLLLSNEYSRIASVEHGLATMQDLEDLSQDAQKGGVATIMFNAATSDLQLFDRNGNLIDQANLPIGIYNNGEPVTVRNKQFVYDEKIWVDPNAIYENANTIYGYKAELEDESYAQFGLKVGNAVDWFDEMDELGASAMKSALEGFKSDVLISANAESGLPSVVAPGPNHIAEAFKASDKLSQPSVVDFFDISLDRSKATPEDIGDDKVIILSDCKGDSEKLIRLLQGYMMLALDNPALLDVAFGAFVSAKLPALLAVAGNSGNHADLDWMKQHFGKYSDGIKNAADVAAVQEAFDALQGTQAGRNIAREILDIYPNEMFSIPGSIGIEALGIPTLAVDPADIQNKYTKTRCDELKDKYAELATEENGLANATTSELGDILRGILEEQVERARKAYLAADNAWHSVGGAYTDLHSVSIRSDGIVLNQDSQQYKISLSEETEKDGKQKIALSTVENGQVRPFAFIGDSGMLGGAPLFSVRIAAHASYVEGRCEWLLNSLAVSDGYEAHLKGQDDNGIIDENDITDADGSDANHLIIMTEPNLSPRDFNKLVIEISGITGSNQVPSHQFKNLNCIVPFRTIIDGEHQRNVCDIDLTEVLYSWVQTDVDELVEGEQLPPDMIIIHAWGMDIKETKRPVKEGQHHIGDATEPSSVLAGQNAMNSNASDSGNVTDIEGEGIDAFVNSDDTYPGMPVYRDLLSDGSLANRERLAYGTHVKILSLNDADHMALLHVVSDPKNDSHNGKLFILASEDHWEHLRIGGENASASAPSLDATQGDQEVLVAPDEVGKVCAVRVKTPARASDGSVVEILPTDVLVVENLIKGSDGKVKSIIAKVGQDKPDGKQVRLQFDSRLFVCFDDTIETKSFDLIEDEASWDASYANGGLMKYYSWADSVQPYKEDMWNTVEHRAGGWDDWHTAAGEQKDENGNYLYPNCIRCFAGALNAAEAKYPWCVPNFAGDDAHVVRFDYEGKTAVFPWGSRSLNWGCTSLPKVFNDDSFMLHGTVGNDNKVTITDEGSFEVSKFKMSVIDITKRTVHEDSDYWSVPGPTVSGESMMEEEGEF